MFAQVVQLMHCRQETEFLIHFPQHFVQSLASGEVPAHTHVDLAGLHQLGWCATLEQQQALKGQDPQVESPVPVTVTVHFSPQFPFAGRVARFVQNIQPLFTRAHSCDANRRACVLEPGRKCVPGSTLCPKGVSDMNMRSEKLEVGGFTMVAQEQPDGNWVGEIVDRAVPQLTAKSLDDLEEQFRSVLGTLAENEAELEGEPLNTSQDAMLHRLHTYPSTTVSGLGTDEVDGPPPEDWED